MIKAMTLVEQDTFGVAVTFYMKQIGHVTRTRVHKLEGKIEMYVRERRPPSNQPEDSFDNIPSSSSPLRRSEWKSAFVKS